MNKLLTATTCLILAVIPFGELRATTGEPHAGSKKCDAPAETCVRVMAEKLKNKGWVGIEMGETDDQGRPVVTRIVPDSPAERAGFRIGDVLAAFNGVSTSEGEEKVGAEVKRILTPDQEITISVVRDGRPTDLVVTLGRIPDYLVAQWIGYHMLEGHGAEAAAEAPRP